MFIWMFSNRIQRFFLDVWIVAFVYPHGLLEKEESISYATIRIR